MTISVNIHEAKAQLSHLIEQAIAGENVCIVDQNKPLVELKPLTQRPLTKRPLGKNSGEVVTHDSFFEPMSDDELSEWYDNPIFPNEKR